MDIEPETLSVAMKDEIEESEINIAADSDKLIITQYCSPQRIDFSQHHEYFVDSIRQFLMMHTKEWRIEDSHFNRIEGYHTAVLTK